MSAHRITRLVVALALLGVLLVPRRAHAWCYCGGWQSLPAAFNVCFKDQSGSCAASVFASEGQYPLSHWNLFADVWRVLQDPIDTIAPDDGINTAAFLDRATVRARYGAELEETVLGVAFTPTTMGNSTCPLPDGLTCTWFGYDETYDVDVVMIADHEFSFDEWYVWDNHYHGPGGVYHFGNVLEHEYGHALGFGHETRVASIMNPFIPSLRGVGITASDADGVRAHYVPQATGHSDVRVAAYGFEDGYYDAVVEPPVVMAGIESVSVSRFIAFNRSSIARRLDIEITVGGIAGWFGGCDLGPHGTCRGNAVHVVSVSEELGYSWVPVEVIVTAEDGAEVDYDSTELGWVEVIPVWMQDRDGDGWSPFDGDCDDEDPFTSPWALDECDGLDNDCDYYVDNVVGFDPPEPLAIDCYDGPTDTDGVGSCTSGISVCVDGWFGECEGQTLPRAERCDGADDDCDGRVDEGVTNACGECAPEPFEVCNGFDDDCDGQVDDGVTNACGGCGPVPVEVCNGLDDDCDGQVDDGVTNVCGGCGPVPVEVCNGLDDDCDGQVDDGVSNACGGCGEVPKEACNGLDDDCDGTTDEGVRNACGTCGDVPAELCNGLDDDCDGVIDEGLLNVCGACGPVPAEVCNGLDDDCDGAVDEDACPIVAEPGPESAGGDTSVADTSVAEPPSITRSSESDGGCSGGSSDGLAPGALLLWLISVRRARRALLVLALGASGVGADGCFGDADSCQCGAGLVCEDGVCVDPTPADPTRSRPVCGNGLCEAGERATSCSDCPVAEDRPCGDGFCRGDESCQWCVRDCGECTSEDACNALRNRVWSGQDLCLPMNDYERALVSELVSVWGQGPAITCSYSSSRFLPNTPCGQAAQMNAMYCPADDSIHWDDDMMNSVASRIGDFAAVIILAHEWGHLNQWRLGLAGGPSNKPIELNADCQAGIFAAIEEQRGMITQGDVTEAYRGMCHVGDPFVSPWFATGAHGTCDERVAAFDHGYLNGRLHLALLCSSDAYSEMIAICGG